LEDVPDHKHALSRFRDFDEFLPFIDPQRQWLLYIHIFSRQQTFLS
jgi:hypothetical protein